MISMSSYNYLLLVIFLHSSAWKRATSLVDITSTRHLPLTKTRAGIISLKATRTSPSSPHTNTPIDNPIVNVTPNPPILVTKRRRKPRTKSARRHRGYWLDDANVLHEIRQFWKALGINSVCIPNESLLTYYERHDLRSYIYRQGGREETALQLGGLPVMAGPWKEAVATSPELSYLVERNPKLSPEKPPHRIRSLNASKQQAKARKPRDYWTRDQVIQSLYQYTQDYQSAKNRPAVWMPKCCELTNEGSYDLCQAITRCGGSDQVCRLAGMVPPREWYYFEGQLELLVELTNYLDKEMSGERRTFPTVSDIKAKGYQQLYTLISFYGGRKFLAARLGMIHKKNQHPHDLQFGSFDIDFALRMLNFVRNEQMQLKPPSPNPAIMMPLPSQLMAKDPWLHKKVIQFGNYENVARRLILGLPGDRSIY